MRTEDKDMEGIGDNFEKPSSSGVDAHAIASVMERYEKVSHLYSTRTADGFDSLDRESGEKVLLWVLRYPIKVASDAADRFVRRLKNIEDQALKGIPHFRSYGIDEAGNAYLVMDSLNGVFLFEGVKSPRAIERRFLELLQIIATFHQNGIILGDLSEDSVLFTEDNHLAFIGLLGSFDSEARQTAMLPPPETHSYLAPEQRTGSGPEFASDVYALGVYGYRLFTGQPLNDGKSSETGCEDPTSTAAAPSMVRQDVPTWIDDILGKCLEAKVDNRFGDASELLDAFEEAMRTGRSPVFGGGHWSNRAVAVRTKGLTITPRAGAVAQAKPLRPRVREERPSMEPTGIPQAAILIIAALVVVFGILAGALMFLMLEDRGPQKAVAKGPLADIVDYAPAELRPLIIDVVASGMPFERKERALRKISESTDPLGYAVLIAVVKGETGEELKETAKKLLLERIRHHGFSRGADVLKNWFELLEKNKLDVSQLAVYTYILNACDATRPLDSRRTFLRKAYEQERIITLQVAAALALDSKDETAFLPVLRELLAAELEDVGLADLLGRGVGALILSHKALALSFDEDVSKILKDFPLDDLKWALLRLAKYDTTIFEEIVNETLSRGVFSPYQSVFLQVLQGTAFSLMTGSVREALVSAAFGLVRKEDIAAIARWMSQDAERPLLVICATAKDEEIALEAFDVLAARNVKAQPAGSLIRWLRNSRAWKYRSRLVRAIAVLTLNDMASEEEIDQAFDAFMPFSQSGTFLEEMIGSKRPRLIEEALKRFAEVTPSSAVIPLLSYEDTGVRVAAVEALEGRNGLGILQAVLRHYDREKDAKVCQAYHKGHWVTRGRKSACSAFMEDNSQDE